MGLCKYKDALGIPNKGVHSYRIFNIAIVDVVLTFVLALILSYLTKTHFVYTLLFTFLLGIFLHRLFCVRTTVDKALFPNCK